MANFHFNPYKQQYDYLTSKTRFLAFIGGIGTGKSYILCVKALLKALNNPGFHGIITAPTVPMLRQTTKRMFVDICPPELMAYNNETENIIGIYAPDPTTGTTKISEIFFRSTTDEDSLRGTNLLWAAMDEAALSSKMAFDILVGRCRAGPPEEQQVFIASTPKGMNWLYDLFGEHVQRGGYQHIYAETYDNPHLPKEYVASVDERYSGKFKEQELRGKFVSHEGTVYDNFSPGKHIGNFLYNPELTVDLAWDFGYPNISAIPVIQQDGNGHVYLIDEIYKYRSLEEDLVAECRNRPWFGGVRDAICDEARPDLIRRLVNLGIPARASRKGKIIDGINHCRALLAIDKVSKEPKFHVDKNCSMFIQEIGLYRWDENTKFVEKDEFGSDVQVYKANAPIDAYNHMMDAWRYWTTSKWNPPGAVKYRDRKLPKPRRMRYQTMYAYPRL